MTGPLGIRESSRRGPFQNGEGRAAVVSCFFDESNGPRIHVGFRGAGVPENDVPQLMRPHEGQFSLGEPEPGGDRNGPEERVDLSVSGDFGDLQRGAVAQRREHTQRLEHPEIVREIGGVFNRRS